MDAGATCAVDGIPECQDRPTDDGSAGELTIHREISQNFVGDYRSKDSKLKQVDGQVDDQICCSAQSAFELSDWDLYKYCPTKKNL